jgi:hypothetical protein
MLPILISKHAREQMVERGVEEHEIVEAIQSGEKLSAKQGRKKFRKISATVKNGEGVSTGPSRLFRWQLKKSIALLL